MFRKFDTWRYDMVGKRARTHARAQYIEAMLDDLTEAQIERRVLDQWEQRLEANYLKRTLPGDPFFTDLLTLERQNHSCPNCSGTACEKDSAGFHTSNGKRTTKRDGRDAYAYRCTICGTVGDIHYGQFSPRNGGVS